MYILHNIQRFKI